MDEMHMIRLCRRLRVGITLLSLTLAGVGSSAAAECRVNRLKLASWLPREGILDIELDGQRFFAFWSRHTTRV